MFRSATEVTVILTTRITVPEPLLQSGEDSMKAIPPQNCDT
jgi:hypothetical protein